MNAVFGGPDGCVKPCRPEHKTAGRRRLRLATSAIVGACLAFAVAVFATVVRLDRDRAFYPTVAIVIASLYSLFRGDGRIDPSPRCGVDRRHGIYRARGAGISFVAVASGRRAGRARRVRSGARHRHIKSRSAALVASILWSVRCRGSGVLGVVDHEPTYQGRVTSFSPTTANL